MIVRNKKMQIKYNEIMKEVEKENKKKPKYIREIYDSPARQLLFPPENEKKAYIMANILPRLNTFRTLVYMHDINRRKKKRTHAGRLD